MNKLICIFLFLVIFLLPIKSQETQENAKLPVKVSIFSEAFSLPSFILVKNPLSPGIEVGTEFSYKKKNKTELLQTLELGYYNHPTIQRGIYVKSEFGFKYGICNKLNAQVSAGPGYLHSIYPGSIFKLNDNGEYEKATNLGEPTFMFSSNLMLSYSVKSKNNSFEIFMKYGFFVQLPYAESIGLFVISHTAFHMGIMLYPFN